MAAKAGTTEVVIPAIPKCFTNWRRLKLERKRDSNMAPKGDAEIVTTRIHIRVIHSAF
jgi:hypothetical protein